MLYVLSVMYPVLARTHVSQKPTTLTTQHLLAQLAANTVCTGGTDKNLCLVSLTTTDNFGNCVVVSQPPSAGVGNSASASATGQAAATGAANVANTRK